MAEDNQKFSLFHDANEAALKGWHTPYAGVFGAGRVADVGCGPGYFLDLLRERGIRAFGIDFDPEMVAASQRRGHEAVLGNENTLKEMPGTFSGVHLSHIIEHLWGDDAVALLENAKTALIPGGVLIVRTPNWMNAEVRHYGFWLDHTHKRPYPKELLEKMLGDMGFEIMQAGFEPGGWQDTFVIARKAGDAAPEVTPPPAISTTAPAAEAANSAPAAPAAIAAAPGVTYKINWRGDFLAQHSFARVNRELLLAMLAHGTIEVVPQGEATPFLETTMKLPPRDAEATSNVLPTFAIKHQWPPTFLVPATGYSIHIQPYEFGSLPKSWADRVVRLVDDVWCPSTYVQKMYLDAGMPAERTFVLPWGVEPKIYHANVTPSDIGSQTAFVFLFVGGAIWRKGIDRLLDAYLAEFQRSDDVALVIKGFGSTTFYQQENANARILDLIKRTDVPVITFSEETFSDDAMATLYKRADVLVLPYRGEGFGLPVLEAMACGTPVIVTGGGATDDFVTDETGWRIPARRNPTQVVGEELIADGWTLEVDQMDLQKALRHAYTHRDEVAAKGRRAAEIVSERYLWKHSAAKALARLDELATRTPLARNGAVDDFNAYEFKIYSQNGEDGLIVELFARLRVKDPFFVEFGAETGQECNTALLARNYGWNGVMIEGGEKSFAALRENYSKLPRIRPVHAMITRENIVQLFEQNTVPKDLDLLSIDVDGNDYHLWEALREYHARVVIIEFNPAWVPPKRWVMQYNAEHAWRHDNYYGASLESYTALGNKLGYALIGIDNNAVNAFFIRRELLDIVGFAEKTAAEAYHEPRWVQPHRDGPYLEI